MESNLATLQDNTKQVRTPQVDYYELRKRLNTIVSGKIQPYTTVSHHFVAALPVALLRSLSITINTRRVSGMKRLKNDMNTVHRYSPDTT
ncbi:unnamed protein product [Adineta steineri]|uniref:Uncharacterized protein n=1 Tax=Adineta steineri TaxID=433720 RepID=A0A819HUB7_9BILA|nr:unnamed protein product [Adineta steineri]CAF3905464.1 unnamed protein product [Adineta steineri]